MKTKNYCVNIYALKDIQNLSGEYRLFEILGLSDKQRDFHKNRQNVINKLSRKLRHPITVIERRGKQYLVTKNDNEIITILPDEYPKIGGGKFKFHDTEENFQLDFESQIPSDRAICERFLQFEIQGSLFKEKDLWQPAAGQPFFTKSPIKRGDLDIFTGFRVRVMDLGNGWGVMIDVTKKYVRANPLPTHLDAETFYEKYEDKHFLYKFGVNWYTVKLEEFEYAKANEYSYIKNENEEVTIIEDIRKSTPLPHSKTLANLPEDGSVLLYYSSGGETRATVSGLCYEVIGTEDNEGSQIHKHSIISPLGRVKGIDWFRKNYLKNLTYGTRRIILQPKLFRVDCGIFDYPDYLIGDSQELRSSSFLYPNKLVEARTDKLIDPSCGFYKSKDPQFCPQYIFLPRSIHDAMGEVFADGLIDSVNSMYPWDKYEPEIKYYEDKFPGCRDYIKLGKRIVETVGEISSNGLSRHALIMIPDFRGGNRDHDELAALLVQELKQKPYKINCSIIHSNTVRECYEERISREGETYYYIRKGKGGKLRGYFRNVANKQVLLANNKYPYILKSPLHADLTIGIDVKNYLAGFLFIDKYARNNRKEFRLAKNPERLTKDLMKKILVETISDEVSLTTSTPAKFVFHRDGHFFDTEINGIKEAFIILKEKGVLSNDAEYTLIEIPKKTPVSLRFLDPWYDKNADKNNCNNPKIGSYWIVDQTRAYICTTGKEFHRGGTSNSLFVRKIFGKMDFNPVLQDLFFLCSLAYTKPDDCSRIPMSIKVLDIHLKDRASDYNKNEFANLLELESRNYN